MQLSAVKKSQNRWCSSDYKKIPRFGHKICVFFEKEADFGPMRNTFGSLNKTWTFWELGAAATASCWTHKRGWFISSTVPIRKELKENEKV